MLQAVRFLRCPHINGSRLSRIKVCNCLCPLLFSLFSSCCPGELVEAACDHTPSAPSSQGQACSWLVVGGLQWSSGWVCGIGGSDASDRVWSVHD